MLKNARKGRLWDCLSAIRCSIESSTADGIQQGVESISLSIRIHLGIFGFGRQKPHLKPQSKCYNDHPSHSEGRTGTDKRRFRHAHEHTSNGTTALKQQRWIKRHNYATNARF